ncbi:MAG: hypothetical protein JF608_09125 [Sphingomonadales bacterium]|jgi:hypothetical protein|nr:hypothetical protein [Sphingomonadales bacterium]
MDRDPPKKSVLRSTYLWIIVAPFTSAFVIAAMLAAGPSEVFKALFRKKRDG